MYKKFKIFILFKSKCNLSHQHRLGATAQQCQKSHCDIKKEKLSYICHQHQVGGTSSPTAKKKIKKICCDKNKILHMCHQHQCWGLILPNSKNTVTDSTCLFHLHLHVHVLHFIYKSPTFSWGHKYPTVIYNHCDKFTCLNLETNTGHLLCLPIENFIFQISCHASGIIHLFHFWKNTFLKPRT